MCKHNPRGTKFTPAPERRLDILEFAAISRALGLDPSVLFEQVLQQLPDEFDL